MLFISMYIVDIRGSLVYIVFVRVLISVGQCSLAIVQYTSRHEYISMKRDVYIYIFDGERIYLGIIPCALVDMCVAFGVFNVLALYCR